MDYGLTRMRWNLKRKVKGERAGEGLVVDVSRYWVRREAGSCDACGISSGASGVTHSLTALFTLFPLSDSLIS